MQLMTNRAPLNRAIFKVSQAIGLVPKTAVAPPADGGDDVAELPERAEEMAV
jgi:hypothetical protein